MQMDAKDDAVRARTAVIEYSSVFTTNPSEANHRQWRDLSDDISAFRPAVWWMLTKVYHHLLRSRPMRNVLPVPETSLTAADLDCRQNHAGSWDRLQVQAASGPIDAAMADELEDEVSQLMGLDRMSSRLALQGRGFQRVRRMRDGRSQYFYQYNFAVNGQKTIKPQFVKRRDGR